MSIVSLNVGRRFFDYPPRHSRTTFTLMNYGDVIGYLMISCYVALLLSNLAIPVICRCPGQIQI